jgi:AcrR family transcriptional regulator
MERPRDRLLAAAVEHAAGHGLADLSLRQLAAALGTSHRMLVYHFGSKEGLLVEVVRAVERQQREALASLGADASLPPGEAARRLWQRVADPAMWRYERLFFELYGQALQGRPQYLSFLDGIVESWLGPATELAISQGVPAAVARAQVRLGIAVTRGLLLDLLATGDREGVDEAMELFVATFEALMPAGSGDGDAATP